MPDQTQTHQIIEDLREWFDRHIYFADPDHALVVALWTLNTWVSEQLSVCPYLSITSSVIGAGKSRLLELIQLVSRNATRMVASTPASVVALRPAERHLTLLVDEAEGLRNHAHRQMRELFASGFRQGQTVAWGTRRVPVSTYCPKAFATRGELPDSIRAAAIVLHMEQGTPIEDYDWRRTPGESKGLANAIAAVVNGGFSVGRQSHESDSGRDSELWAPLFSVGRQLGLSADDLATLRRCEVDLVTRKFTHVVTEEEMASAERRLFLDRYGQKALRDIASIVEPGETFVKPAEAIARMRQPPTSPWRGFGGTGLTPERLSELLAAFDVRLEPDPSESGDALPTGFRVESIVSAANSLPGPAPPRSVRVRPPALGPELLPTAPWMTDMEPTVRKLLELIGTHGLVTEDVASTVLGSTRALRRFDQQRDELTGAAPWRITIESIEGVKRYKREDRADATVD